jgi:hypothetical protein
MGATVDLVPSIHSTVSGAQSSSSSSMSAHLDSFPFSSADSLVAMWIPYCCFNSSSVNCLGGGGATGLFLFQTLLASGPGPAAEAPDRPVRVVNPPPMADLATRRGFAPRARLDEDSPGLCALWKVSFEVRLTKQETYLCRSVWPRNPRQQLSESSW